MGSTRLKGIHITAKMDITTLNDQDTLSAALHVLAGDVCLRISPGDIEKCRPFCLPSDTLSSGESELIFSAQHNTQTIRPESLSTWLCKDGHFFTLFRSENSGTLVFSHTNEVLYHASMAAQLSQDCPVSLCFLCQFTTDDMPGGSVPRLLAFDVMSFNKNQGQMPPCVRGDMLRSLQAHLPQPLCIAQWIGPRKYLSQDFATGLPHKIRGLIALGSDPFEAAALELR